MMERREVVGGGLLGLTALFSGKAPAGVQRDEADVARAVERLRESLEERLDDSFADLREIRQAQRTFLKANYKYPDFIEIGIGAWDRVYDWHVRHQVPPTIARRDDGRYTMTFMFTTLVLRPEMTDGYVGFGFDAR